VAILNIRVVVPLAIIAAGAAWQPELDVRISHRWLQTLLIYTNSRPPHQWQFADCPQDTEFALSLRKYVVTSPCARPSVV
jgi:hypothetical protein